MESEQELHNQLFYYTLSQAKPEFIHQYVVDAYAAQHADAKTKPITIAFALVGLYLHIEKGFTGRAVQKAHMLIAKRKKQWPTFDLPKDRGAITIAEVMHASPGANRDEAINRWSASV